MERASIVEQESNNAIIAAIATIMDGPITALLDGGARIARHFLSNFVGWLLAARQPERNYIA